MILVGKYKSNLFLIINKYFEKKDIFFQPM